jgi:hypothetical protein
MADLSSGPEPSTAAGNSPEDGHLRSRPQSFRAPAGQVRLPQAQAENILASLASRPPASGGPAQSTLPRPQPSPPAPRGPVQAEAHDHKGVGPGPDAAGTKPSSPSGTATFKSHPTAGGSPKQARATNGPGGTAVTEAGARPVAAPAPAGLYGNDILPVKPTSRFRFRLR